jgi:PKD repeat protein
VPVITLGGNQTIAHNSPITITPTITPYDPSWTYTYAWNLGDGTTATSPTVTHSYSGFGMYTVSLTVTDPYGTSGTGSVVLTVVDTPPVASNVLVSQGTPGPQQPLTLTYTYSDADGDPENGTTIMWFLNSQLVATYNNLTTVPASVVQRNQKWYAVVTPKDGYLFGTAAQSNTLLIGDPPPTVQNVALTPAMPMHADTLHVTYTYSDPFGYPESGTTIAWTKNGVAQPTFANQTMVPPPLTKGDVWVAKVTPSDGYSVGTSVSSSPVTVQDTAPVLSALPNIAEPAQALMTSVSWMVSATDSDGDSITFDCSIGSMDLGPGPAYAVPFPVGTTVVTCTASDGTLTTTGSFTVAIGDVPPVVAVTQSQTINPGIVTLAANGMDPLGRPITYSWSLVSGPTTVQLTGASTSSVTFPALTAGAYVMQCTVSNGTEQASAQTTVTVLQLAPLVNLGPSPRTMVSGETITLDGTHSVDPNGGTLSYQWAVTSGEVQLSSSSTPTVTLTSNVGGRAIVALTVSDGVHSASGSLAINIWGSATNPDSAPYAIVAPDQTVLTGAQVTLDGTPSFDPNAHVLSYSWVQMSGPTVALMQAATAQPQFVAQTAGTYIFELTVTDRSFSSVATSMVTVLSTMGDTQPVAVIHPADATAMIGETTTLDGSGSMASPGQTLTYQWTRLSGPYVVLSGATSSVCSITLLGAGEVVMQLVVSDGTLSSLPVQATIHATEGMQTAPTAVAKSTATQSFVGLETDLDGSASVDPNGLPLIYQWTQLSGGPVAIHGSETAHASFTPSTAGASSFQLTVFDWIFSTSAQTVITVQTDNVPVAVATGPVNGYVGDSLSLDGTQSHDPAGAPLSFIWTQVSGPQSDLQNTGSATPSFSPRANGTYVFQLQVSNGQFMSQPVTVTVSVQNYPTLRGGCASQPGPSWLMMCGLLALIRMRRRAAAARAG